ncbi:MAG TPA: 4Fe-4S dicluster domain-containing protein, partial [Stellaceae bacterium]
MARPVKIEGNPDHPASLGAASAQIQATILGLYDPRRAQTIIGHGQIDSWQRFVAALYERRAQLLAHRGDGLRLLTGTLTSPSLAAQIAALQQQFPGMQRHQWEPLNRDNELLAAQKAFGRPVENVFDLGHADVVLAVESDLLSAAPGHLAYARAFAARRRPDETKGQMSRVYAVESTPTLLGAKADHRLALRPQEIAQAMRRLAAAVGAGPQEWKSAESGNAAWIDAAAQDLAQHKGHALVHAGREQPVETHLLAAAINVALGAYGTTVRLIEPVAVAPEPQLASLEALVADMMAGKVDTLLMLETNPLYTAPADLDFAAALKRVPFSVSLAPYADETALASTWHIPAAHEYEAWSDARAFDGTVTIQQPQVRRFYGGRSAQELLAVLQGNTSPVDYDLLRAYWQNEAQQQGRGNFETFWHEALRKGVVEKSAAPTINATPRPGLTAGLPAPVAKNDLAILFRADEGVGDGRDADNAWLLEMPRPFTRLTWDNAALVAPATAKRLGIADEDMVTIAAAGRKLRAPVFVLPGQAPDCVTLPLGFGRRAGGLGVDVGFDAYSLRTAAAPWLLPDVKVAKTGDTYRLAGVQGHDRVAGLDLVREGTLAEYGKNPHFLQPPDNPQSLYPPYQYPRHAWAMAIDLNSCIGCQACVVACQAENNVPVVGKDQVLAGREMHWLRIDRYYSGPADAPETAFEPVPCMHCENAPCEVVCPVHATVHDHDGLNVMVYNRCVGTRFCSNNCPYKVRRFNFFAYAIADERP